MYNPEIHRSRNDFPLHGVPFRGSSTCAADTAIHHTMEEERMNFTPQQQAVFLALTTEWQTPVQIASHLSDAWGNPSHLNERLKELMSKGLVQANPVVPGLYRLTTEGMARKLELGENR